MGKEVSDRRRYCCLRKAVTRFVDASRAWGGVPPHRETLGALCHAHLTRDLWRCHTASKHLRGNRHVRRNIQEVWEQTRANKLSPSTSPVFMYYYSLPYSQQMYCDPHEAKQVPSPLHELDASRIQEQRSDAYDARLEWVTR